MNVNYLSVTASQGPAAGSTLLNNLIEYWKLDESSGNFIGEVNANALVPDQVVQGVTGKITNAMECDNIGDSATMNYNSSLSYGTTDSITISFWIWLDTMPSTLGYTCTAFRVTNASGSSTAMRIQFPLDGAYYLFYIVDALANVYSVESSYGFITTGTWHHILCYKNSTTSKTYIDGVDRTSTTYSTPNNIKAFDELLNIGNYSVGSSVAIDGKMCEFAYWNRQLTVDEIAELYNSGNGKTYPFTS